MFFIKFYIYVGSSTDVCAFIKARGEAEYLFTGHRNTAMEGWKQVLDSIGLAGMVSPLQARKKWDNLKSKCKELKCPPTGTGTDNGEDTAASWPWYSAMDELLGQRHSIAPPVLRASLPCSSSMAEPNSMGAVSSPQRSVSSPPPREESQEPPRKRRYNMAFVGEMMERAEASEMERQRREMERQERAELRMDRLLAVMERLAEK
ncbi:uncharacterized protein LOC116220774 [Clupea harengus]|uniref:Uncharacterized protein LOC116220774 n=1 Tax=Clupea harengus TaxID=7950 RepID=A0A6P8FN65_CLUHA|nr:uncharacterized protein LOC116220774 [Clupea harengus]